MDTCRSARRLRQCESPQIALSRASPERRELASMDTTRLVRSNPRERPPPPTCWLERITQVASSPLSASARQHWWLLSSTTAPGAAPYGTGASVLASGGSHATQRHAGVACLPEFAYHKHREATKWPFRMWIR